MMPGTSAIPRAQATKLDRFLGYFIDVIILIPVYFVLGMFLPVVGSIALGGLVAGLLGAAWLLVRDSMGLSIGKKIMGLQVVSKTGGPATQDQLMKRNFTLAAASAVGGIPFLNILGLIGLVECILLLAKGERYGDQMASTMVVKK